MSYRTCALHMAHSPFHKNIEHQSLETLHSTSVLHNTVRAPEISAVLDSPLLHCPKGKEGWELAQSLTGLAGVPTRRANIAAYISVVIETLLANCLNRKYRRVGDRCGGAEMPETAHTCLRSANAAVKICCLYLRYNQQCS
jgi:hypothetical protein